MLWHCSLPCCRWILTVSIVLETGLTCRKGSGTLDFGSTTLSRAFSSGLEVAAYLEQ